MKHVLLYVRLFVIAYCAVQVFWIVMHCMDFYANGLESGQWWVDMLAIVGIWLSWATNYILFDISVGSAIACMSFAVLISIRYLRTRSL